MHQLSVCVTLLFRIALTVNSWGALLDGGGGGGVRNGKYKNGYCSWSTKDCKGPHTNMPKHVGSIKTWSAKITSRQFKFCRQNTAILIVLGKSYLCRTSTRHRKNSKQSGIVAIDSCFAIIVTLQCTWESRHITCLLEGKSPSVNLNVSQRK